MACRLSIGFLDCTLYSRNEARTASDIEGRRAIMDASPVHLSSREADDVRRLLHRVGNGYVSCGLSPLEILARLKDAVANGGVVVVSASRTRPSGGAGGNCREEPVRRHATVTPSQLFGRARAASSSGYFERTRKSSWIDLPAFNGPAIFSAKPGDVLPDGRIATAIKSSSFDVLTAVEDVAGAVSAESNSDDASLDDGNAALDAAPFEYSEDSQLGDVLDSAARAVSEMDEAICFAQYERDLDMCNALGTAMGGSRGAILCRQNAFDRYQQCRGF